MWQPITHHDYESLLDDLAGTVVQYINDHPELREQETEDMFDYYDADEDRDDDEDDEDL